MWWRWHVRNYGVSQTIKKGKTSRQSMIQAEQLHNAVCRELQFLKPQQHAQGQMRRCSSGTWRYQPTSQMQRVRCGAKAPSRNISRHGGKSHASNTLHMPFSQTALARLDNIPEYSERVFRGCVSDWQPLITSDDIYQFLIFTPFHTIKWLLLVPGKPL